MKTMFGKRSGQAVALALALWPLLTLCTACDKDVRQFTGTYSSKTSGLLTLHKTSTGGLGADTLTVSLTPESGQMRISEIKDDPDGYNLLVSVNLLGGDALSFRAKAKDGQITLETTPHEHFVQARDGSNSSSSSNQMTLSVTTGGTGRLYDDVIVFSLDYRGGGTYNRSDYVIAESRVDCIATANE